MLKKGNPCIRDCKNRGPGCTVNCPDWARYVKDRDQDYKRRAQIKGIGDAIHDGYRRLGSKPGQP